MSSHVENWLPGYVLGDLSEEEEAMVGAHLKECSHCLHEQVAVAEALNILPLALPPRPAPAALRSRLLQAVDQELQAPFGRFIHRLASLFDLGLDKTRQYLDRITDPAIWVPGPGSGIELIHVVGGPKVALADAGFVRMEPHGVFSHHLHKGEETVLVMEGAFRDESGEIFQAGDVQRMPKGSSHSFQALGEGCLFAAVVLDGIVLADGSTL